MICVKIINLLLFKYNFLKTHLKIQSYEIRHFVNLFNPLLLKILLVVGFIVFLVISEYLGDSKIV